MQNATFHLSIYGTGLFVKTLTVDPQVPWIVFLHEGLGCVAMWKDFPEQLCRKTGLNGLLYDRRGHGQSAPVSQTRSNRYLHEEALEYLPALLAERNITEPILLGHSDGGTIALIYGAHYHPKAIIALAAHIHVEVKAMEGIRKARQLFETTPWKDRLTRYHGEKSRWVFESWANTWLSDEFQNWTIETEIGAIRCPTLLVQGDDDEYATPRHLWDIRRAIGLSADALLFPQTGHSPHLEAGEKMISYLDKWLAEVFKK